MSEGKLAKVFDTVFAEFESKPLFTVHETKDGTIYDWGDFMCGKEVHEEVLKKFKSFVYKSAQV